MQRLKGFNKFVFPEKVAWFAIGFGIVVRVAQYIWNRSLWADEAVLALNIVNRSFWELLQPLDYDQGAPLGFLMVEKLAVEVFGNNEYALRLFPLICGVVSLVLFYQLANRFIQGWGVTIAVGLFASLHYLVYYSSEVKQYSCDLAIALLCSLISLRLLRQKLGIYEMIILSLGGAIAIWFSHPAIFVLAGVGGSCFLLKLVKKENIKLANYLVIYSSWIISFVAFYLISIKNLSGDEDLLTSWRAAFPSFPLDIIWYLDAFGKFFYRPLGFNGPFDGLAIIIFVVGCIACYRRNKQALLIIVSPILVTFLASALQKYPFRSRLVLFLTPFVILLIAEGVDYIRSQTRYIAVCSRIRYTFVCVAAALMLPLHKLSLKALLHSLAICCKFAPIVNILLLFLLLAPPIASASQLLVKPYLRGEIKPVLSYIKTNQQPGDTLYIYQRGKYQFIYYAEKFGYQKGDYIIGVDDLDKYDGKKLSEAEWQRYKNDLDKLRGNKRVWLLFSHATVASENKKIKSYLDTIGKQINFFERPGAFVYLYDLS
ncbi:glycosyltransferase family 39 protein [Microseira wollei]|uniref:Glycosyltransferase RgtA/B/C/D-like domain-containing protein n=1 Tax=Microseira wollei NIES-4236 TaxID=2530354 RepID=A0AAV3X9N3_9CYAN|nr:glycosyltransferase family 39 protein [Microseira wollei]GET37346.1 hypothetical protein MiSe_20990 [Microseira wollei NIES-4236]